MLLLDDARIVLGASSKTALNQQVMQLEERRYRHARRADLHSGAGDRIQHPRRHYGHYAGCRLDVDHAAGITLFAAANPDTTPKERVPLIMDFHLLPDMGRMTWRLRSAARTTCSRDPMAARSAGRSSPR